MVVLDFLIGWLDGEAPLKFSRDYDLVSLSGFTAGVQRCFTGLHHEAKLSSIGLLLSTEISVHVKRREGEAGEATEMGNSGGNAVEM